MKKQLLVLLCMVLGSHLALANAPDALRKEPKDSLVVIGTSFGEITLVLFYETPEHRKNFLKLANEHFFDSTTFHRIIKGFMIQGGDPNSKDSIPYNDGWTRLYPSC
jgi:hypothetical protein